jgi:hypothetical protein
MAFVIQWVLHFYNQSTRHESFKRKLDTAFYYYYYYYVAAAVLLSQVLFSLISLLLSQW